MQPKRSISPLLFSTIVRSSILGIVGMSMLGCTPPPPAESESPRLLKGKTLKVACPSGPPAAVMRTYSKSWSNREGATVEVSEYEGSAGPETVKGADIWVMPPAALARKAAAGLIRPLPTSITGADSNFGWTDLLPIYRERLLIWDRNRCALPILGEAPLCIYRADYLNDPARAAAFQKKFGRKPAPPATWEDFVDLAEHFRDTAPGGPAPSLPPLPADDAKLDREFFTIAACYARRAISTEEPERPDKLDQLFSFQYDQASGKPRIDSPGFVYALNLLKRLQKCRPAGTAADPGEAFRSGQAALGIGDVNVFASMQKLKTLADKASVCRMPGGGRWFNYTSGKEIPTPEGNRVPYLGSGGWIAAVPLGAAEPDAAFSLLTDLAGRERSGHIVLHDVWGGRPIRREQVEHSRIESLGFDAERTKQLREAMRQTLLHPGMLNPAVRLRTPTEATHQAVLLKELRAFLQSDGGDAAKALANVAALWTALDREREGSAALDDYRISVGLLVQSRR
jgi:multiple sugar transport system substrate-binding protein